MTSLNAAASPVLPLVYERSAGYWETVGRRFLRDKVAVGAALVVLLLMVIAGGAGTLAGPVIGAALVLLSRVTELT